MTTESRSAIALLGQTTAAPNVALAYASGGIPQTSHRDAELHSPDFAAALAERGYAVAPVVPDGQVPGAPDEWFHEAVDLYGLTGKPTEMVERVHDLWERAWRAGRESR